MVFEDGLSAALYFGFEEFFSVLFGVFGEYDYSKYLHYSKHSDVAID